MLIDLAGASFTVLGDRSPVVEAATEALLGNGGTAAEPGTVPDLLLVTFPLLPDAAVHAEPLLREAQQIGTAMAERGSGRILFVLSSVAAMPMRRFPEYSAVMAGALATMRVLAMGMGPAVLVNAVGVGAVGEPLVAGDAAMPRHAALRRAGAVEDAVAAILFFADPMNTYTTGQILSVDGGWTTGYGRSF